MSNAIQLLESLGEDAELQSLDPVALETVMRARGIDSEVRTAILARDFVALGALLGASGNVVCGVFPGREDEPSPDQEDDDEQKDSPDRDSTPAQG